MTSIEGFQPRWKNQHAAGCEVTKQRGDLWSDFVKDPLDPGLQGAIIEYDGGGDQEVENCTCGKFPRMAPDIIDKCDVCGELIHRSQMARFEYRGGGMIHTRSIHESCSSEGPEISRAARTLALAVHGFRAQVAEAMGQKCWSEGPNYLDNAKLTKIASDLRDLADLWERG